MNPLFLCFIFLFPDITLADVSVSPSLYFARSLKSSSFVSKLSGPENNLANVTLRFSAPPIESDLISLEEHGITFSRSDGHILHSTHIYPARVNLDSLESILSFPGLERIENSFRPAATSTLDVSNPQVQASGVWNPIGMKRSFLGDGVTIVDVDTGIDIYHPAFFKTDGGTFSWIDVNSNGVFDSGIDGVDLNENAHIDTIELLRFYDAPCKDSMSLLSKTANVFDADFDWLYNDANRNGLRDFGPNSGFTENSPCYGERIFFVQDSNSNNRLDPGEPLIGLGTSKIRAIFDKTGKHLRGVNLLTTTGDLLNHGTAALGVAGGQHPGRRLTGMAPGAEFISINRGEANVEESAILAREIGANIYMYEYGSWVYEPLDGSSNMEVLIDDLYSQGFHQFTASGNLAGPTRKRHASLVVSPSMRDSLSISIPAIGIKELYLSIMWRGKIPSSSRPAISFISSDGTTAQINGDQVKRIVHDMTVVSGYDYSSRGTARYDVQITSPLQISGTYTFTIKNRFSSDLKIHAYLADDVTQWMNGSQFLNHVTDDGTICSPGTSLKGITVGAYDPRGTRNPQGDINDFSSWGKTIDGRMGVEITAPGTLVFSLISSSGTTNSPGGYFEFGGTSAALPHVAGCAALLLEAWPGLTPDECANALENYALHDSFTGPVPNDIWGYGKLRMHDVFSGLQLITAITESSGPEVFSVSDGFPNPFNASVTFKITSPAGIHAPLEIAIYNVLGQKISTHILPANGGLSHYTWNGRTDSGNVASSGLYFLQFRISHSVTAKRILLLR